MPKLAEFIANNITTEEVGKILGAEQALKLAPLESPDFTGEITLNGLPITPNDNGTSYVMVYGVGTPEENGEELQAAYNLAKNMPRYLGMLSAIPQYFYAGQTYYNSPSDIYLKVLIAGTYQVDSEPAGSVIQITEKEATNTRTVIVVAPGKYYRNEGFPFIESGINISSLTNNRDVIIESTMYLDSSDCSLSGLYIHNLFSDNYSNQILKNCTIKAIYGAGTSGDIIDCDIYDFYVLGGDVYHNLINCKFHNRFTKVLIEGALYNCIDFNGDLLNYNTIKNKKFFDAEGISTMEEWVNELNVLVDNRDGSYIVSLVVEVPLLPQMTGTFNNCSLLVYGGCRAGFLTIDNGNLFAIDFVNYTVKFIA